MLLIVVGVSLLVIVLIAILFFGRWLRSQTDLTTQDKIGSWDIFVKLTAGVGVIISALFTAWQYLDQREQELVQRRAEFVQQIYDDKRKVYDEAVAVVGSLISAATLSESTTQQYLKTFWELYWGKMVSYETPDVEVAMVQIGRALKNWEMTKKRPSNLGQLSLSLATAVKNDLVNTRPTY